MRIGDRGPQDAELTPRNYVRRTALALWDDLPLVTVGGLLFSLLCAPACVLFVLGLWIPASILGALTLAPGWSALLALEAAILRSQRASLRIMAVALRRYGIPSMRLGLLLALPLALLRLCWIAIAQPDVSLIVWSGLALSALGALVLFTFSLYAFPLLVLHEADVYAALRDGAVLASRYITNTLGLLSMGILFGLAVIYVSLAFLFIFPAIYGMFIVNNCQLVLRLEGFES